MWIFLIILSKHVSKVCCSGGNRTIEHNTSQKKMLTVKLWVSICFAFCHSMKSIHLT